MRRIAALDRRIQLITDKVEENKKPFSLLMVGGIILATITYFVFIFFVLRLIVGIGASLILSLRPNLYANSAYGGSALTVPQFGTGSSFDGQPASTYRVYTYPAGTHPLDNPSF